MFNTSSLSVSVCCLVTGSVQGFLKIFLKAAYRGWKQLWGSVRLNQRTITLQPRHKHWAEIHKLRHFWSLDVRFHLSVQFCLGASHWFDVDKIPFQKRRDVMYTGTSVATFESECNGRGRLLDFTALNHIWQSYFIHTHAVLMKVLFC